MTLGHPTPPMLCTTCGTLVDRAASADGDDSAPTAGALSLCTGCGAVNVFTEDLHLRPIQHADIAAMSPISRAHLAVARAAIRMIRKYHPLEKDHEA